jgi:hypothetical protein
MVLLYIFIYGTEAKSTKMVNIMFALNREFAERHFA